MKTVNAVISILFLAAISLQCQKEFISQFITNPAVNNQPAAISATLQGNILDENGQPAASVKISVGTKSIITNSNGYFRISNAQLDKNASVVTAELPGYFKAYRSFSASSGVNQVVIQLIKKSLVGSVDALRGGKVTLANGAGVALPANGVRKVNGGGVYTGTILVYAVYIDPGADNIGKIIPGSLMADDKDHKRVVLNSYGMMAVELESEAGEKLQIMAGNTAKLTMPIANSGNSTTPDRISLWHVDEKTGIWQEEGTAQKEGNNYVGNVSHFSYWNCDVSLPAIGFTAQLKTANGSPLVNANVRVRLATSTNGYAHGYTDSLGQLGGLIPVNSSLVLEVLDYCNQVVFSKNIGPFTTNTDLGTLTMPASNSFLITVKGKLLTCNNTPVLKGHILFSYNNFINYVTTDGNGNFSADLSNGCSGIPASCILSGVDEINQQQGYNMTLQLTAGTVDAGNIKACGNSSQEFIKYTLDGVDYSLSEYVDSMYIYEMVDSSLPGNAIKTLISGGGSTLSNISFNFTGGKTGLFPVANLHVASYSNITIKNPFNITVTTYPQFSGDFYGGNFNGSFTDGSTNTTLHTINGTFRVKKY
ncbi:hypothetical protein BH11BAC3_BH11BAC3_00910 [soil metagenome]